MAVGITVLVDGCGQQVIFMPQHGSIGIIAIMACIGQLCTLQVGVDIMVTILGCIVDTILFIITGAIIGAITTPDIIAMARLG